MNHQGLTPSDQMILQLQADAGFIRETCAPRLSPFVPLSFKGDCDSGLGYLELDHSRYAGFGNGLTNGPSGEGKGSRGCTMTTW